MINGILEAVRQFRSANLKQPRLRHLVHNEMLEHRHLLAGDLVGHFSAESLTNLADGDTVTEWTDSQQGFIAALDVGTPTLVKAQYGGRAAIRFSTDEGDDALVLANNSNPIANSDDFSVVVVFATATDQLLGGNTQWFENTGIVDANTLGFTKDWGISLNSTGQIATGLSGGGLQQNSSSLYSTEMGLNDGELHIATVARRAGELSIYVDDANATSASGFDITSRSADKISIGRLLNRKNGFNGDITEVRFYNGQLTTAEVASLHSEIFGFYNNAAPVPQDDHYQTNEDVFLGIPAANGVLINDIDADGDVLTAEIVEDPANGRLGFQPSGGFFYTPNKDFFGTDTFTYRAVDFRPSEIVATVTIEVTSQYDAAVPVADGYKAVPTEVLRIPNFLGVLQNDVNIDRASLKAVLVQDVENGLLTLQENGSFDYDAQGFSGITSFQYSIDDGTSVSNPVAVQLTVNTAPVSADDAFEAFEDVELSVSVGSGVIANDVDADGNNLTATVVETTQNGVLTLQDDGSFTYLPNPEYSGPDSFTYRVTDGHDESSVATASISVSVVNDLPVAGADSYFALPGESLTTNAASGVLANDTDIDGPEITAILVDSTQNGNLTFQADGSFSYIPTQGFEGTDRFTYKAFDSIDESAPITVEIQITSRPLIISEIMVSNASTLETILRTDLTAEFEGEVLSPDWIELRNLLPTPLSIGGLHLTDDAANPTKWQIPNGTFVPGDGYLVIFASGENLSDPQFDQNGLLHTNFVLSATGEYLAITSTSGGVIDEFKDGYPNQRTHITYGAAADDAMSLGYFLEPTPGAANGAQRSAIVEDTKFNIDRGFFAESIEVTVTTATADAEIRYTLDGSFPSETNGSVYNGPLTVGSTTTLRAAAFKDGMVPTNIDTATYLFLDDILDQNQDNIISAGFPEEWSRGVVGDYGLDDPSELPLIAGDESLSVEDAKQVIADALTAIPSFSIVTDNDNLWGSDIGIYSHPTSTGKAWERPTSVEMINPDGTEGFQIDAGVRIQGGAFRNWSLTKKKSLRLLFKSEYGPGKLSYPLFGPDAVGEFDTLTLRMEANDGWQWGDAGGQPQYARDQFLRNVQLAMGQPASHGRAIHVYLNGLYWGMYNIVERPDETFAAAYLGSNKYDWDGTNSGTAINAEGDAFRSRRIRDSWRGFTQLTRVIRDSQRADEDEQVRTDMYLQLQGLNPDGTRNPEFPVYLDPENMIDYFIVNYYGDNSDWPFKNYYYGRENSPDSEGFQFFMWDAEWSLFLRSNVTAFSQIRSAAGVAQPFLDLRDSAEFRVLHGDQVHKHFFNGGVFYVDPDNPNWDPENPERNRPAQLYNIYVNEIYDALPAESARWGDQHRRSPYARDREWQNEYDRIMESWFPRRSQLLLARYIQEGLYPSVVAATFSQRGGTIESDIPVTLSAPEGTIYYTTDDSDPRLIGGDVNPNAMVYTDAIALDSNTTIKVRVLHNDEWSAIDEASFVTNAVPATADSLRISEVHYNPGAVTQAEIDAGFSDKDDFEFIEFVNISNQAIDLTNVSLQQIVVGNQTEGVDFDFSAGEVAQLQPGERLVVVENVTAFSLRYGENVLVAGAWNGGLGNNSETITVGAGDDVFQQFVFQDEWFPQTDGLGRSLEVINPAAGDLNSWNDKNAWRASATIGGSPGADGEAGDIIGDSNHDGVFNSSDLVVVFQAGEYEDDIVGNSTFEEGDWNLDGDFTSRDLVFAFQEDNYVAGSITNNHRQSQANLIAGAVEVTEPIVRIQTREMNDVPPVPIAEKVDLYFGEFDNENEFESDQVRDVISDMELELA